ncbi:MAG TPA: carboxypeptidase-like regulatory domain-containing protein, partial [Flavisolibacter sp.]|nr:carboxypeptidase-like regulatory domain-containing protein [Flavisolibacter sp.]
MSNKGHYFLKAAASIIAFTFLSLYAFAQDKFTISGTVRDKQSGESLIGASVKLLPLPGGTVTNAYGFFSLTLAPGAYTLQVSFVGYTLHEQAISLSANQQLVIELQSAAALQEVIVSNKKKNANVSRPIMGMEKLNVNLINQLPVLLGERDVLKSIQLLPGVKGAGEGNSGFYVRGGGADQNLILLDEAPVYNASHLLGFFSTFNSDAIKDVTMYKGGMPSQYGGRLSSVVDVKMKDGNNRDFN